MATESFHLAEEFIWLVLVGMWEYPREGLSQSTEFEIGFEPPPSLSRLCIQISRVHHQNRSRSEVAHFSVDVVVVPYSVVHISLQEVS